MDRQGIDKGSGRGDRGGETTDEVAEERSGSLLLRQPTRRPTGVQTLEHVAAELVAATPAEDRPPRHDQGVIMTTLLGTGSSYDRPG